MVATEDVGRTAAELLLDKWNGQRVVQLEGPERITPDKIAATFAGLLGRDVRMQALPRDTWESVFRSQAMKNPMPRIPDARWIQSRMDRVRRRRVSIAKRQRYAKYSFTFAHRT